MQPPVPRLTFMHGFLVYTGFHILWRTGVPPKCRISQGPQPSANVLPAWTREETYVWVCMSYGGGTSHIHAAGVHYYRWHGTLVSSLSQATSGTPVSQERRGLLDYDVLDKTQNLICNSENIPPILEGIAFNGLWYQKRTFRTVYFDLEKRYWILHITTI